MDSEQFFTQIESAVRTVEKIRPPIRELEKNSAIARARTTQLARATRLRYPESIDDSSLHAGPFGPGGLEYARLGPVPRFRFGFTRLALF